MSEYLALAGRITESVDELHRVVDRAEHLCKKAVPESLMKVCLAVGIGIVIC